LAGLRAGAQPPAPTPLEFTVDGETFTLGSQSTRWWLRVLSYEAPGCWFSIIPLSLESASRSRLLERITDDSDRFDLDELEKVAEEVVGVVLGMEFWAGHRLLRLASSNWLMFDGWCLSKGIDVMALPPGRVASAVYGWRMASCQKESDKAKIDSEIFGPPPLRAASGRLRDQAPRGWDDRAESSAFMTAVSNLNSR